MPASGARSHDRAAPQNHGGNGAGLGKARQGGRRRRRSRVALNGFFLGVLELPLPCQTAPCATRWPGLSGHGARSPSPSTRRRSVDTRRIAPLGPCANLAQRGEGARRSGAPTGLLRDFHAFRVAERADNLLFCVSDSSRDTGGGAPLGDRMSNPARVASRRGSSCAFATCVDFAKSRLNSPRPTFFPARCLGRRTGGATAWP
jgi:hypothetical protein